MTSLPTFDNTFRILYVAAEVAPFAKTGGLADVAGSLPKALRALGNEVRVVMPRYRFVEAQDTVGDFPVLVGNRMETAILRQTSLPVRLPQENEERAANSELRLPVYLLDNYHYFYREGIYGYHDEGERFAFFGSAVLQMLRHLDWRPDIIHCNDWHTGAIPLLLKTNYRDEPFYKGMRTLFTIHNLHYQGNVDPYLLSFLGIEDDVFHLDGVEFFGAFNFLKAGIVYADAISTVSKTYARQIQTAEFGEGLNGVLRQRADALFGIVNGLNYHEYNPRTDPRLHFNFGPDELEKRKMNKHALQRDVGLATTDQPVLGMVTRLVEHKGLDLVLGAMDDLMRRDVQFVLLGVGDPYYEEQFGRLQQQYPDKVAVRIAFDVALAQRIYSGVDLFLMPSRFEPCGLSQLIALRYGAVPIVRATGGLADTISDYGRGGLGNGFVFQGYTGSALLEAFTRALAVYHEPDEWRSLVVRAMSQDFSWNRAAAEYMGAYQAVTTERHESSIHSYGFGEVR